MKHHLKSFIMQGLGNVNASMDLQPYLDYHATLAASTLIISFSKENSFLFKYHKIVKRNIEFSRKFYLLNFKN